MRTRPQNPFDHDRFVAMNELAGHALIAERRYMTVMPSRKRAEDKRAQHKQPEQPHPEQTHVDHLAPRLTDRFRRLERALEEGLEDTFPASDAIAVVQPAPLEPDTWRTKSQRNH
jgi:hypothetical protein